MYPRSDLLCYLKSLFMEEQDFILTEPPQLPYEIEHHMPDYHLYDNWIEDNMVNCDSNDLLCYLKSYLIILIF